MKSDTINQIVATIEAQKRGRYEIVSRRPLLGSDGRQYGLGLPLGVRMVGVGDPYWVFMSRHDGTTHGKRYPTEREAIDALEAWATRAGQDMRTALEAMTDEQIKSQASYWLEQ